LQKLQVVDDFVVVEAVRICRSAGFSGTQGGMLSAALTEVKVSIVEHYVCGEILI
jgi:hypothetical protein